MMTKLYHVSSSPDCASVQPGDIFYLDPGPQGAEGRGVYFSEERPRFSAAEGSRRKGVACIVVIDVDSSVGWWRTKTGIAKKYNRPRTWHTKGKSLRLTVMSKKGNELFCSWIFVEGG
jgi:hypothetical protein